MLGLQAIFAWGLSQHTSHFVDIRRGEMRQEHRDRVVASSLRHNKEKPQIRKLREMGSTLIQFEHGCWRSHLILRY